VRPQQVDDASSHANSNAPGRGSSLTQEKIATLTRFTPASRINRVFGQISSGHCQIIVATVEETGGRFGATE